MKSYLFGYFPINIGLIVIDIDRRFKIVFVLFDLNISQPARCDDYNATLSLYAYMLQFAEQHQISMNDLSVYKIHIEVYL